MEKLLGSLAFLLLSLIQFSISKYKNQARHKKTLKKTSILFGSPDPLCGMLIYQFSSKHTSTAGAEIEFPNGSRQLPPVGRRAVLMH